MKKESEKNRKRFSKKNKKKKKKGRQKLRERARRKSPLVVIQCKERKQQNLMLKRRKNFDLCYFFFLS